MKPAQHKHVAQRTAIKMYEEIILPIYEKRQHQVAEQDKGVSINYWSSQGIPVSTVTFYIHTW